MEKIKNYKSAIFDSNNKITLTNEEKPSFFPLWQTCYLNPKLEISDSGVLKFEGDKIVCDFYTRRTSLKDCENEPADNYIKKFWKWKYVGPGWVRTKVKIHETKILNNFNITFK